MYRQLDMTVRISARANSDAALHPAIQLAMEQLSIGEVWVGKRCVALRNAEGTEKFVEAIAEVVEYSQQLD